jgi:hypothetical protein
MSYGNTAMVAALCKNTLAGAANFSTNTNPTITEVESWLSSGCAIIEARLSSYGYAIPASEGTAIYDWLADLNNLFAASKAEMSRVNVTLGPGERTRGQVFYQMFKDGINEIDSLDLTSMGLSRISDDAIYVGGVSQDTKDTYEDDSDRVKPRFARGQFAFDETIRPDSSGEVEYPIS